MENEKKQELVKRETPPSFIEKLMLNSESLEQIKEVGMVIIKSGFCPDHFKANNDAVGIVMCIEAGRQLGLTWMQSLSDLYPVKGRIGMMGAAARSLIFSSGVLDKWEEVTEGTYPEDTYKHIIISKRKGLPGEFRSEFSVYDAKKAGLFGKDIYQRYGKRMIMWRNIGFHATDYYGDVMKGMKTVEELNDFDIIPGVGDTFLEQEDGSKIKIQGGSKQKSIKMTDRVVDKIPENKFGEVKDKIQEAVVVETEKKEVVKESLTTEESPFIPQKGSVETFEGKVTKVDGIPVEEKPQEQPLKEGQWTLKQMEEMDTKILLDKINADMDMMEAMNLIPGKNTNKKLREIIFAQQGGRLAEYVAPFLSEKKEESGDIAPQMNADIAPNKEFDKQKAEKANDDFINAPMQAKKPVEQSFNKYAFTVPPFDKGEQREFGTTKALYNALAALVPPITNARYLEIGEKVEVLGKYADKENFCKFATVEEVNLLLNAN